MQLDLLVWSPIHSLHFPDSQHTVAEIHQDQGDLFPDPTGWANRMLAAINTLPADHGVGAIPDLNRLASHYLTHLCIARMLPVIQCLYPSDSHNFPLFISLEPTWTFDSPGIDSPYPRSQPNIHYKGTHQTVDGEESLCPQKTGTQYEYVIFRVLKFLAG